MQRPRSMIQPEKPTFDATLPKEKGFFLKNLNESESYRTTIEQTARESHFYENIYFLLDMEAFLKLNGSEPNWKQQLNQIKEIYFSEMGPFETNIDSQLKKDFLKAFENFNLDQSNEKNIAAIKTELEKVSSSLGTLVHADAGRRIDYIKNISSLVNKYLSDAYTNLTANTSDENKTSYIQHLNLADSEKRMLFEMIIAKEFENQKFDSATKLAHLMGEQLNDKEKDNFFSSLMRIAIRQQQFGVLADLYHFGVEGLKTNPKQQNNFIMKVDYHQQYLENKLDNLLSRMNTNRSFQIAPIKNAKKEHWDFGDYAKAVDKVNKIYQGPLEKKATIQMGQQRELKEEEPSAAFKNKK